MNLLSKQIQVLLISTFSALSCLNALVDFDNDGFSDLWEEYYGLCEYDSVYTNWDEDGDGFNSIVEMWAGTDPKDASQAETPGFYASSVPAYYSKNDILNLRWTERSGVKYRIYCLNNGQISSVKYFTGGEALSNGLSRSYDSEGNAVITYHVSGYSEFVFDIETWWNASAEVDDDNDGLSNLEEFYFGSSPYLTNSFNSDINDYGVYMMPNEAPYLSDTDPEGLSYVDFHSFILSDWNHTWFGWIYPSAYYDLSSGTGWVYHLQHRWIYVKQLWLDGDVFQYVDEDLGFIEIRREHADDGGYWLKLLSSNSWLYYVKDSKEPRIFYSLTSNTWFSLHRGGFVDVDQDGLSDLLELNLFGDLSQSQWFHTDLNQNL